MMSMHLASHEPATVMMIGCLSEERDDVRLWDRYASNGAGCVVGIDASWLANRTGATLRRISYEPGDMRDFLNAGLLMLQGQFEEAPKDTGQLSELSAFFILDLYAFKDPRFRSEHEVRISRLAEADASTLHGLAPVVGHNDNGEELPPVPVQLFNSRFGKALYRLTSSIFGTALCDTIGGPRTYRHSRDAKKLPHAAAVTSTSGTEYQNRRHPGATAHPVQG
ncbi:hypothetical protein [Rhizobium leguminosarum]